MAALERDLDAVTGRIRSGLQALDDGRVGAVFGDLDLIPARDGSAASVACDLSNADMVTDVRNLRLWLKVNGETMQDGNTANFIFNVPHVVSYFSQFITLLPGDVISTGTPAGVGLGLKPPRYLKPSDVIELGIDGLGEQRQGAVAYNPR